MHRPKNRVFSARAPPSKLLRFGTKGAFRNILRPVIQKWISQNSTKRGPFGSAGGRIPEGWGSAPPPPKSATDSDYKPQNNFLWLLRLLFISNLHANLFENGRLLSLIKFFCKINTVRVENVNWIDRLLSLNINLCWSINGIKYFRALRNWHYSLSMSLGSASTFRSISLPMSPNSRGISEFHAWPNALPTGTFVFRSQPRPIINNKLFPNDILSHKHIYKVTNTNRNSMEEHH